MGDKYVLDSDRERAMSDKYADTALGRSSESTTQKALDSFAQNIKESDQSMMDMLLQLNKSLVRLSQSADSQSDELHKNVAAASKSTADAVGAALTAGDAVTGSDIEKMQDSLTNVIQSVNNLGPGLELTAEMNESIKELRADSSDFAARMMASYEAVQKSNETTNEKIVEVAEAQQTPGDSAKAGSEKEEGGVYEPGAVQEAMTNALKYPVGILLDAVQLIGDIGGGLKAGFGMIKSGYDALSKELVDAYDKSVGRIVTGVEAGMKKVFNVFFKDTAMALGFVVGTGYALKDQIVAGFDWFRENWQEGLAMIGAKIGEAWDKFKEVWSSDIAPAIGSFVMDAMLWLWDQYPAIKDWLEESLMSVVNGIEELPTLIYEAIWAKRASERAQKSAVASQARAVKETLSGVGSDAFTSATAAGISTNQAFQFSAMAESNPDNPEGVQEAVGAYAAVIKSGGDERAAMTAARKALNASVSEADVPSITDREKATQRKAVLPPPAQGGSGDVVSAIENLGHKMGQKEAPRTVAPGLDTTGGPDDLGIVAFNTGGLSGGMI